MSLLGVLASIGTVPVVNITDAPFNAVSGEDCTLAITAAITAAGNGDAIIYFPHGLWLDSAQRDFDGSNNLIFLGPGSNNVGIQAWGHFACEWRYTGTDAPFISAGDSGGSGSSNGIQFDGLAITYADEDFVGDLVTFSSATGGISRYALARNCYFGGRPMSGPVTARSAMNLDGVAWADFHNCTFARCVNGLWGVDTPDGYSNAVSLLSCTFSENEISVRNPGEVWTFTCCVWEPQAASSAPWGTSGKASPIVWDDGNPGALCQNLTFTGCGFWDTIEAGAGSWFQFAVPVVGISVVGCRIDAHIDDGPLFDLAPGSYAINFHGNTCLMGDGVNFEPLIRVDGQVGPVLGSSASANRLGIWIDNTQETATRADTPQWNQQDQTYTLTLRDVARTLYNSYGGGTVTVTLPPVADVPWPADTVIRLIAGSQPLTVAPGAGIDLRDPNSRATVAAFEVVELVNVGGTLAGGSNRWTVR